MARWFNRRTKHRPRHRQRYRRRRYVRRWHRSRLLFVVALVVVGGSTALLDWYRTTSSAEQLTEYARGQKHDPAELAVAASRSHRVIFLGDVRPSAEAKRVAGDVIEALARGPGLDAVALEVPSDEQATIDRYMKSEPEDIALLLNRPRTVRSEWDTGRAYLDLYRRIWRLNRELPPSRAIRVIAADLPGWPPERMATPAASARLYAAREKHMAETISWEVFRRTPNARVLTFMGGYHGLKGGARVHYSGGRPVEVTWLAERLRTRGHDVYTILTDAPARTQPVAALESYGRTRAFDVLNRGIADVEAAFALTLDEHFDFLSEPIREARAPGLTLELRPADYRLRQVADAYLYLAPRRLGSTR